jgi:hypothetical protein
MKKVLSTFKHWIVFWIGALLAIVVWVFAYNYVELNDVNSWDTLTASSWNTIWENIRYLKDKIEELNLQFWWQISSLSWQVINLDAKNIILEWKVNSMSWQIISLNWTITSLNTALNQASPQNAVMAFYLTSCPSWWKPANGSNNTPDLRWKFIRWLNSFENGSNKLTWANSDEDWVSRTLGSLQGDTIRNIVGNMHGNNSRIYTAGWWAFYTSWLTSTYTPWLVNTPIDTYALLNFDASRIVPTWNDNRPKNIALIYCIKE